MLHLGACSCALWMRNYPYATELKAAQSRRRRGRTGVSYCARLKRPLCPSHTYSLCLSLPLSLSFYFIWPQQNVHCTKLLVQSELILELVLFLIILISRWKYTELTNKCTLNLIIDFLTVQAREIDSHTVALKMPVSLATLAMLMA